MDKQKINIEFLYLDLEECGRCRGTNANLDAAVAEVSKILKEAGVAVSVKKTQVTSERQARKLELVTSPTIRVNGKDIALELRESCCRACTAGCEASVNCRVWVFQGREYTVAPKAMIIDAILREVYAERPAGAVPSFADVPENLKRYFAHNAGHRKTDRRGARR
jgi:hypothetical protein